MEDLINYWYIWITAALFFGCIAFCVGAGVVWKKKSIIKCFLPVFSVELAIAVCSGLNVKHWVRMGASFRWVIYEHGPEVYIVVIAFVFILMGYLTGMVFARKKG